MAGQLSTSERALYWKDEAFVVEPKREHRQTFIILHGRGSNGKKFGTELLLEKLTGRGTLPTAFPDARFIFPTAPIRRAQRFQRMKIRQWFDKWSTEDPEDRRELQIDGLRETTELIHGVLREETKAVGIDSIFLGGLSQGCAAGLIALLLWEGKPLPVFFGMCGYLPFNDLLAEVLSGESSIRVANEEKRAQNPHLDDGTSDSLDITFEDPSNCCTEATTSSLPESPSVHAIDALRQMLSIPSSSAEHLPFQKTRLIMGHGAMDEMIPHAVARKAAQCLRQLGVEVSYHEYPHLGHWYSEDMLTDVAECIEKNQS